MELFFLRHSEYERLYNCTGIDIDTIPFEQRRHMPEAVISIVLCAIYYVLYIPCMFSIWKHMADNACYQLLFYVGIMDISVLWIPGFLHGWLSLNGAMFCSYPTLIYLAGCFGETFWFAETSADTILAINRCVTILFPELARKLFDDFRTAFWLLLCTFYALLWLIFHKPIIFNGLYFSWFYYPFLGYRIDTSEEFVSKVQFAHNLLIGILLPSLYLFFGVTVFLQRKHSGNISQMQKMTFLQVFLISIINFDCAIFYAIMQIIEPREWMIMLAQFGWLHIHGFPPVIYLALNKTVRHDCLLLYL